MGQGQRAAAEAVIWTPGKPARRLAAAKGTLTYEQQLEERLKELLSHVEGVGKVEVMIVLKSSEEKVWRGRQKHFLFQHPGDGCKRRHQGHP